jgi:hypothetical protein
MPQGGGVGY